MIGSPRERRAMTLKRYPDGVEGQAFFEKRCPSYRPEWVRTINGPGGGDFGRGASERAARGEVVPYCAFDEVASLVWAANLAALELHAPMAREDLETPAAVVFDLDPGPPADVLDCRVVALELAELLDSLDLVSCVKTSGSKGLQLYVPLNTPATHDGAAAFAKALGDVLAAKAPDRVLTVMRKDLRGGKVFVDWSQNSRHKTTVSVYSLRARPRPTVSTPVTWDEVERARTVEDLTFEAPVVLERVAEQGDVFAPLLDLQQPLPELA